MRDERIHGVGAETPTQLLLLPAAAEFGLDVRSLDSWLSLRPGRLGTVKSLEH
jgi:hypothetical protein